ncbi:MAG: hypothetical protein GY698_16155 [Actinomycetia bacterium]|nr:hypothetical protein [Actinomycetes bacterium]
MPSCSVWPWADLARGHLGVFSDLTFSESHPVPGAFEEELDLDEGSNQTINRNGDQFSGIATFDVEEPGFHRIELSTTRDTQALVTRSLTEFGGALLGGFALAGLGGVLVVGGIVLAVVGWLKRNKAGRDGQAPPPPGSTPAPPQSWPPPPSPPTGP